MISVFMNVHGRSYSSNIHTHVCMTVRILRFNQIIACAVKSVKTTVQLIRSQTQRITLIQNYDCNFCLCCHTYATDFTAADHQWRFLHSGKNSNQSLDQ